MTNQRICDLCGRVIENKSDYIKLQMIKHKDNKLEYLGVGHMCLPCWEKTK